MTYRIARGAHDDFTIDPENGLITVSGRLDFDRRAKYVMEVVASDGGSPSLSGTATLTVEVMNKNDKVGEKNTKLYYQMSLRRHRKTRGNAVDQGE